MGMIVKSSVIAGVCALMLTISGCANAPKPTSELVLTEAAIQNAEAAGARKYAPLELRQAREKQAEAQAFMKKGAYDKARRSANEALVNAELAEAAAEAEKSRLAVGESREGLELMESELQRVQDQQ